MKFQHGFINYNKCKTLEGRLLVGEMIGEPELRGQGVYGKCMLVLQEPANHRGYGINQWIFHFASLPVMTEHFHC